MMTLDEINAFNKGSLMEALGIKYTLVSKERVEATMPVNEHTRQPFGVLHGGASLALAETVAGVGSMANVAEGETVVGMQVSGSHVAPAMDGDTVLAVATPIKIGMRTHVWNVDVIAGDDTLVSTIRVVNHVISARRKRQR